MLFTPREHGLWDTWVFPHGGRYYLFWLQNRNRKFPWDSIAMAESDDLIHWKEYGTVLEKAPDAEDWMGTGRTWQAGNRFYMNFSEIRHGKQEIHFAVSDDLRHWQRLDASYVLRPDPRWYPAVVSETPDQWLRWDTLVPVQRPDGSWFGFVSGVGKGRDIGAQGVVGAAASADGIHWSSVAPASEYPCALTEVSGHIQFDDRHYVFIGSLEGNGPNLDERQPHAPAYNGMAYWCSSALEGPYAPPAHPNELQGTRSQDWSAYFGTAFRSAAGETLWNHHWIDTDGRVWLAPIKALIEERPWQLALKYWPGNEALKGKRLVVPQRSPGLETHAPIDGRPTTGHWDVRNGVLAGESLKTAALATMRIDGATESGCVVEAIQQIGRCVGAGAGLFIGGAPDKPAQGLAIRLSPEGRASVGRTCMGRYGPQFNHWETFSIHKPGTAPIHFRAIIRDRYVELFANDWLLRTLRLKPEEAFSGRIGLWLDGCEARLSDLNVWAMDIPRREC